MNVSALSGPSLPSSSNSSAGPSSPTSASTPIDFLNKVKLFIIDSAKNDQTDPDNTETEQLLSASQPEAGNQSGKPGSQSQQIKQTGSPSVLTSVGSPVSGHMHQSAFKVVSRSGSQKSSFQVSQVSEESLRASQSPEKMESPGKQEERNDKT